MVINCEGCKYAYYDKETNSDDCSRGHDMYLEIDEECPHYDDGEMEVD